MQSFKGTGMALGEELHRSIRGGVKGVYENLLNQL